MSSSSPCNYSPRGRLGKMLLLFSTLCISILVFKTFTLDHQYQLLSAVLDHTQNKTTWTTTKSDQYLKNVNEEDMQKKKRPLECRHQLLWNENKCLQFKCEWRHDNNTHQCDNIKATNYTGEDPPCCVHTLRDMAQHLMMLCVY